MDNNAEDKSCRVKLNNSESSLYSPRLNFLSPNSIYFVTRIIGGSLVHFWSKSGVQIRLLASSGYLSVVSAYPTSQHLLLGSLNDDPWCKSPRPVTGDPGVRLPCSGCQQTLCMAFRVPHPPNQQQVVFLTASRKLKPQLFFTTSLNQAPN